MANKIVMNVTNAFPALSYRNFRLFWTCQLVSLIGTWMQNIGQAWLVLQITESAFKLGVVTALQFLPITFFSLFAGPLIDRLSKRKILLWTQFFLMILAVILATLTYLELIEYWHIIILAILLGLVSALDVPARQAFVIELVSKESLMNAIALNSMIFNLGRMVGPAVAGILIGLLGMATCFYLNAISFCVVIAGLYLIRVPDIVKEKAKNNILSEIGQGLTYIRFNPVILFPLTLLAMISAFVLNYNVVIPVFAKERLAQGALGYGFLMTSVGIGSFFGALNLAANSKKGPRMKMLFGGALGASVLMFILGFETNYVLACATLVVIGFCNMTFVTSVNSTIQINSQDNMRGRVMSVYSLFLGGLAPFGSLFAGQVSELAGVEVCITISGFIGMIAVIMVYKRFSKVNVCQSPLETKE